MVITSSQNNPSFNVNADRLLKHSCLNRKRLDKNKKKEDATCEPQEVKADENKSNLGFVGRKLSLMALHSKKSLKHTQRTMLKMLISKLKPTKKGRPCKDDGYSQRKQESQNIEASNSQRYGLEHEEESLMNIHNIESNKTFRFKSQTCETRKDTESLKSRGAKTVVPLLQENPIAPKIYENNLDKEVKDSVPVLYKTSDLKAKHVIDSEKNHKKFYSNEIYPNPTQSSSKVIVVKADVHRDRLGKPQSDKCPKCELNKLSPSLYADKNNYSLRYPLERKISPVASSSKIQDNIPLKPSLETKTDIQNTNFESGFPSAYNNLSKDLQPSYGLLGKVQSTNKTNSPARSTGDFNSFSSHERRVRRRPSKSRNLKNKNNYTSSGSSDDEKLDLGIQVFPNSSARSTTMSKTYSSDLVRLNHRDLELQVSPRTSPRRRPREGLQVMPRTAVQKIIPKQVDKSLHVLLKEDEAAHEGGSQRALEENNEGDGSSSEMQASTLEQGDLPPDSQQDVHPQQEVGLYVAEMDTGMSMKRLLNIVSVSSSSQSVMDAAGYILDCPIRRIRSNQNHLFIRPMTYFDHPKARNLKLKDVPIQPALRQIPSEEVFARRKNVSADDLLKFDDSSSTEGTSSSDSDLDEYYKERLEKLRKMQKWNYVILIGSTKQLEEAMRDQRRYEEKLKYEEERLRKKQQLETKKEEAKHRADEAKTYEQPEDEKIKAEEEAKKSAEEEHKKKTQEEAKKQAEMEAKRKADEEAHKKAEEEQKRKIQEEAKKQAEMDAKRKADEEAQKRAEDIEKRKAEEEKKKIAKNQAKKEAEEEGRRKTQEEARRKADAIAQKDVNKQADLEAKKKAEQDKRRSEELEAQKKAVYAKRMAEEKKRLEESEVHKKHRDEKRRLKDLEAQKINYENQRHSTRQQKLEEGIVKYTSDEYIKPYGERKGGGTSSRRPRSKGPGEDFVFAGYMRLNPRRPYKVVRGSNRQSGADSSTPANFSEPESSPSSRSTPRTPRPTHHKLAGVSYPESVSTTGNVSEADDHHAIVTRSRRRISSTVLRELLKPDRSSGNIKLKIKLRGENKSEK